MTCNRVHELLQEVCRGFYRMLGFLQDVLQFFYRMFTNWIFEDGWLMEDAWMVMEVGWGSEVTQELMDGVVR